jgi:hypothetical protein
VIGIRVASVQTGEAHAKWRSVSSASLSDWGVTASIARQKFKILEGERMDKLAIQYAERLRESFSVGGQG